MQNQRLGVLGLLVSTAALWAGVVDAGASTPNAADAQRSAIVLSPQVAWEEGCGSSRMTDAWWTESTSSGATRFRVSEPGKSAVFNFPARLGFDARSHPILSMTYRGSGLQDGSSNPNLLVFFEGEPNFLPAVKYADLTLDGEPRTVDVDLRTLLPAEASGRLERFDLRIHAQDESGVFELIDLRFRAAEDNRDQAASSKDIDTRPVRVVVHDTDGQPLKGARVTLGAHLHEPGRVSATTDAEGRATLQNTHPTGRAMLKVEHDGRAALNFRRLGDVGPDTWLETQLPPATTLGGVTVNEDGDPVAGAMGVLWMNNLPSTRGPGAPRLESYRLRVFTDADGRWGATGVPSGRDVTAQVRWLHPDYLADRWGGQFSGKLTPAALADGSARSVLKRGIEVAGRVLDRYGEPLAGASVTQGSDRFPSNAPPATTTDADGRFYFKNTEPGELVLTVTAPGHAPQLVQSTAAPGLEPIEFQLEEAATFRFRVVDSAGAPIAGASICPDTWRGFRTIPGRVHTNKQGLATWRGPHDPVEFDIFARGRLDERGVVFSPSEGEDDVHEVTLGEPLRVSVTVTDATTGQPITSYMPLVGILWDLNGTRAPHYRRDQFSPVRSAEGKWEQVFGYPQPNRVIRIEAEGYAPAVSDPIAKDAGHVELAMALHPAESLTGTLVDPSGQPVPGADVYLTLGSSNLYINSGRVERNRGHARDFTGDDGRFEFPPQDDQFMLVALHDRGYAEVTADEWRQAGDGRIVLQPWAVITGRVLVGDQPAADGQVGVWTDHGFHQNPRPPHHDIKAPIDADGRFTIDRVPAGKGGVGRYIQVGERSWGYDQSRRFELAPGERLEVSIGGAGRPVIGRFIWPEDALTTSLAATHHSLRTHVDQEAVRAAVEDLLPKGINDWSIEERQAFAESDKGKALQKKIEGLQASQHGERKYHNFRVEPDGSFRIENVAPGDYSLTMQVMEPPVGNACGSGESIGTLSQRVTVPPLPEGVAYLDEPLDVGTLEITPVKPAPGIGDALTAFTLPVLPVEMPTDAAGGVSEIDLEALPVFDSAALRGKVALIYFGASWCGPCHAEAPHLVETWDAFRDDPRFAMISVSLDQKPGAAVRYADEKGYGWPQLFPVGGFRSSVVSDFGVRSIPSIWIIGPDGRVVAKNLRGPAIRPAAKEALNGFPQAVAR
ncbi:MAG: carboxypeptidase regulatory-like domain-containing protein [Planctomycetota bacterium]